MPLNETHLRRLGRWAADCAERALLLFEGIAPGDLRPREAIEAIRAYAGGEKRTNLLRKRVWAALAAARATGDPSAAAAARSAAAAAGVAYMHAEYTPGQEKHLLAPPMYAALARELEAGEPSAADREIRWAVRRATPAVRQIARSLPALKPGSSRQDALMHRLDAALRAGEE